MSDAKTAEIYYEALKDAWDLLRMIFDPSIDAPFNPAVERALHSRDKAATVRAKAQGLRA